MEVLTEASSHIEYPANVTVSDITYFMVAPTLCYQVSVHGTHETSSGFSVDVVGAENACPFLRLQSLQSRNGDDQGHILSARMLLASLKSSIKSFQRLEYGNVVIMQIGYPRTKAIRKGWVLRQTLKLLAFTGLIGFIIEQVYSKLRTLPSSTTPRNWPPSSFRFCFVFAVSLM